MQNKSTIRNTNNTTQHQSIVGNIYTTNMSPQSAPKLATPPPPKQTTTAGNPPCKPTHKILGHHLDEPEIEYCKCSY